MFLENRTGTLVPIRGEDPQGRWEHVAFLPDTLPADPPTLRPATYVAVADARAALATLDTRASLLPNPGLLRRPTLRVEAQSTSALEGTYAPLEAVLAADNSPAHRSDNPALKEVLNFVTAAEMGLHWVGSGRAITVGLLEDLQGTLVRATAADGGQAGRLRTTQVVIGRGSGHPVTSARFIPPPPGPELATLLRDLIDWMQQERQVQWDPLIATAVSHYQFESLHPFHDGNGRIGRLLIIMQLLRLGLLTEPTLTVSPWFEARRDAYYAHLLAISTCGEWDSWVTFFAEGIAASATSTCDLINTLIKVQGELKDTVRAAGFRAESAMALVDFALARTSFTVNQVQDGLRLSGLTLSYGRVNKLVGQLVDLGILTQLGDGAYDRRFTAPAVRNVLLAAR